MCHVKLVEPNISEWNAFASYSRIFVWQCGVQPKYTDVTIMTIINGFDVKPTQINYVVNLKFIWDAMQNLNTVSSDF